MAPYNTLSKLAHTFNTITGLSAADKIVCISPPKYPPQLSTHFHDSCVAPRPGRYIIPINQIWHAFTADEVESLNGLGKVMGSTRRFESCPARFGKILLLGDVMRRVGLRSQVAFQPLKMIWWPVLWRLTLRTFFWPIFIHSFILLNYCFKAFLSWEQLKLLCSHEQKGLKGLKFLPFIQFFHYKSGFILVFPNPSHCMACLKTNKPKKQKQNIGICTICLFKASEEEWFIKLPLISWVNTRLMPKRGRSRGAGSRIPLIGRHCHQTCAHHGLKPRGARG